MIEWRKRLAVEREPGFGGALSRGVGLSKIEGGEANAFLQRV